jgi:GST-like protein
MAARPAVKKGMEVGAELSTDPSKLSDEEKARIAKILMNQRAIPIPKEWSTA